jgi:hypothetical protein
MFTRRFLLPATAAAVFVSRVGPVHSYQADAVEKAIKSGKPVVVHVYAPSVCNAMHRPRSFPGSRTTTNRWNQLLPRRL